MMDKHYLEDSGTLKLRQGVVRQNSGCHSTA